MGKMICDFTGQKFGKLTAVSIHSKDKFGHMKWLCKCECGNETVVLSDNLKRNHTTSCGCERKSINSKVHKIHGQRPNREYAIWDNMMRRCGNPNRPDYNNYGGRGIKVCKRWYDFTNFWEDMKETYQENLTLDRIDVNGDYCKENCRWATMKQQANNTRVNHYVILNNKKMTLQEACDETNMNYYAVWARLKLKWSFKRAIGTPIRIHK